MRALVPLRAGVRSVPITYICVCGKKLGFPEVHSGQQTKCPFCGDTFAIPGDTPLVPLNAPRQPPAQVLIPTSAPATPLRFRCNRCHSTQVKRLAMVHASGIQETKGTSIGFGGLQSIGMGVGLGGSSRTTQTGLSRGAAPPEPPPGPGCLIWGCATLGSWILLVLVAGLIVRPIPGPVAATTFAIACVAGHLALTPARKAHAVEMDRWRFDYERWQRTFLCLKCGSLFEMPDFPIR